MSCLFFAFPIRGEDPDDGLELNVLYVSVFSSFALHTITIPSPYPLSHSKYRVKIQPSHSCQFGALAMSL